MTETEEPHDFAPESPLVLISPHLDDVVHSCAHFLARRPGATVVTVFAGANPVPASRWDRATTGEEWAPAAVERRRHEDAAALSALDAAPVWLPLVDGLYGDPDRERLRAELAGALSELRPSAVVAPLGIRHPDHVVASDVCLELAGRGGARWYLYEDMPYAQEWPDERRERLSEVTGRVRGLTELRPVSADDPAVKARLMEHYASQVPALRRLIGTFDRSMGEAERYWCVDP
jgi:LmbE family N-acetylglucosaminyl deacetylase